MICELRNQKIISDQVEFHPSQVSLLRLFLTPITSYYIPIHGEKEKRQQAENKPHQKSN